MIHGLLTKESPSLKKHGEKSMKVVQKGMDRMPDVLDSAVKAWVEAPLSQEGGRESFGDSPDSMFGSSASRKGVRCVYPRIEFTHELMTEATAVGPRVYYLYETIIWSEDRSTILTRCFYFSYTHVNGRDGRDVCAYCGFENHPFGRDGYNCGLCGGS